MNGWLGREGKLLSLVDTLGQLMILSLMWLLGCLPIVTVATSTTALYYAVAKSIRRGRGDAVKEFLASFRRNLLRGILTTLAALALAVLLGFNAWYSLQMGNAVLLVGNAILLSVLAMLLLYVGPVLSRFQMKTVDAWKLSFVISIRFLPYTLALLLGLAALAALQLYVFPMAVVAVLPGAWCYVTTFPIEKALCKYIPDRAPEDDAWYFESVGGR